VIWFAGECGPTVTSYGEHMLAVRLMRIRAGRAGWTRWERSEDGLGEKGAAWPDATAYDPEGRLIWIGELSASSSAINDALSRAALKAAARHIGTAAFHQPDDGKG
jgi:hypothetical protein